ncbi:ACT domain-containing protein [Seleniivibrio sp.]|uniref:ACT domain-containing protein n=1 Tax=Seleniivibrio sp. TaxID=2898801 RepID=UPI0025D5186C|nr:ACT domain-containing protein [Seleniivibrio sp.]MCD8554891.1 ACT domain-containing protein [Seleniivibrio sp.]
MKLQQISVFIENQSGRLYDVANLLGQNGINIRALSLADTSDFGILRLIVNNPESAYKILKDNEFTVGRTEVVAVEVKDRPGGLAEILGALSRNEINVEYMYAFVEPTGSRAIMIFRFDETDKAVEKLSAEGFTLIPGSKIYGI